MTYPVTLRTRIDAGLCAIRGQWRRAGQDIVATYATPDELQVCVLLSDAWRTGEVDEALAWLAPVERQSQGRLV